MPRSKRPRPPPSQGGGGGGGQGPARKSPPWVGPSSAGRSTRNSPRSVSRQALLAHETDSSSDNEDTESETDDRSSASESDTSASESDAGTRTPAARTRESEGSPGDSDDTESAETFSEDEADEEDEGYEDDEDETLGLDSRVEVRVHVHEAKELTPMDGSSSDPYAYVTCFEQSQKTKTASKGTDAIWDEELQFSGTAQELEGGVVRVAVWDEDLGLDDHIGSFDFDLEDVRKRPHKEYYKTWVTLFDSTRDGPQGKVRVSITILEPGDELPPRPGTECPEDSSRQANFDLLVRCFCAEGLPQMDRSGLADPYVSLFWGGKKARTPEVANTLNPRFYQELILPVQVEGNPEAPPTLDLVLFRVREYNRTGNTDIAYGSLYLSDIQKGSWAAPCWLNLYGAPRDYGEGTLRAPTITGQASIVLEQMNSGKQPGNTYRGRVLLSAKLNSSTSNTQVGAQDEVQDGSSTRFEPELEHEPVRGGSDVVPWRYPVVPTALYTLHVGLLLGCDLPVGPDVFIRVSWGVPKTNTSSEVTESGVGADQSTAQNRTGSSGIAIWNELLTLEVEWPLDPWQVPDIFVELIQRTQQVRTHFIRISVNNIDDVQHMVTGVATSPILNGRWYKLPRSTTEQIDASLCDPRVLMCLGIECNAPIRRVARDTESTVTRASTERWQSLRQIKAPHVRQHLNMMSSDDETSVTHQKGDATTPRNLSVSALRKRAIAVGVSKNEMKRARDSDMERRTLTALLLEHLVRNGGHKHQADHQLFDIRVHVYQARNLQLEDPRGPMPVLVAQMWEAADMKPPIDMQTAPAAGGSPQSPCWYETLRFEGINLPGSKAGDLGLRTACPLLLYVQQHCNPRRSAPTLIGRLRVPIFNIRANFQSPSWVELKSRDGNAAGELLVGFEMYAETQRMPRTMPRLRPSMITANLTVVVVGGRNFKDANPTLGQRFGSASVRTSNVEIRLGAEEARSTIKSDGANPTYLHTETWYDLEIPENELFAPSLYAQVFHEAGMMSTVLLGTAELNLAKHVRKFVKDPHQLQVTAASKYPEPEAEPEPVEWTAQKQRVKAKSRKVHAYTQLESSDESDSSESESIEDPDEGESEDESTDDGYPNESARDFGKGAAANDSDPRPFFAKRQGQRWRRFTSHQAAAKHLKMKPSRVVKCLDNRASVKGFEFKYAVEAEGVKKLDPAWRIGRRRALDELENCYPDLLDTYDDLHIKVANAHGILASAGTLKVWIGLWYPTVPGPHHPMASAISTVVRVTVRAYIVRAFRLTAKDAGNTSDPYVKATLDGATGCWPKGHPQAGKQVEKAVVTKTLNPYFGQVYEWNNVNVPGTPAMKVEVFDDDTISDDPMGATEIDIEERFFSHGWQQLGVGDDNVVRRPSECRDLFLGDNKVTQGSIEMWIEIFPISDASRHPYIDISPPEKQLFELRVVVWDACEMVSMDMIGDNMNDLFISGHLYYRDSQNRLRETVHETDIHWRAREGKGSFNYRLVFQDLELPIDDVAGDSDFPRFVLRAWDQDVIGEKDLIGSANIEIRDMFRAGWNRLQEQQARDDDIAEMSGEELKQALSEMWNAEFEQANKGKRTKAKAQKLEKIESYRKKLPGMDRAKMRKLLVQSDPKRSLSYTSVRLPDPQEPASAGAAVFADDANSACHRCCTDACGGVATDTRAVARAVLSAKPSRECCIGYLQCRCLPGLCRSLCRIIRCVCRVTCRCGKSVSRTMVDAIKIDPVAQHNPLFVNFIGANAVSDSSSEEEGSDQDVAKDKLAGIAWASCGKARVQLELLPKTLADERPVGKGREEPNQFPKLPEPENRVQLSLNPFTMLTELVGPSFASKLVVLCLGIGCCVLLVLMLPLILSNIIAHVTEHAMGI